LRDVSVAGPVCIPTCSSQPSQSAARTQKRSPQSRWSVAHGRWKGPLSEVNTPGLQELLRFIDVDSRVVPDLPRGGLSTRLVAHDPAHRAGDWSLPLGADSTRFHTLPTRAYLSNAAEVEGWLRAGDLLPEWAPCVLDNACAVPPIESTSAALRAEAEAGRLRPPIRTRAHIGRSRFEQRSERGQPPRRQRRQ
jgi:hypothetical protein